MPREMKSRSWFFTWNNPDLSAAELSSMLAVLDCKAWIFQLERGEEGTPHYQGAIYTRNPQTMPTHLHGKIHWEKTKSWAKAIKYCSKVETRVEGPYTYNVSLPVALDIITVLRPWQLMVKEIILQKPNDRKILWLWEPTGNAGKTAMARYICHHFEALYLNGKGSDAKYAVSIVVGKGKPLDVVIFGYPRSSAEYINYGCIEEIKDGIFFNAKYESGMVMYNPPHVIVFSNEEPDYSKMSEDRWDVRCIDTMALPPAPLAVHGGHQVFQPYSMQDEFERFLADCMQ